MVETLSIGWSEGGICAKLRKPEAYGCIGSGLPAAEGSVSARRSSVLQVSFRSDPFSISAPVWLAHVGALSRPVGVSLNRAEYTPSTTESPQTPADS